MVDADLVYTVNLLGSFRMAAPTGERIEIASRKGMALIAMLATAKDGERSRAWLQDRLWGSRQRPQAQSSLRRELSALRQRLNTPVGNLLVCNSRSVKLDLRHCRIDAHGPQSDAAVSTGEFLEGFDIAGEDGFEEWLRDERRAMEQRLARSRAAAEAVPERLSVAIVDLSQPKPGFAGRPAVAVLRFANQTGDASHDYLAEAIGEELIDRLSRLRWLPVIARSSSFSLANADANPQQASVQLGARYVLEGRLRPAEVGFWVTASLIDAESGLAIWSLRLALAVPHTQAALDLLVRDLVAHLDSRIDHAEQRRAVGNRGDSGDVRDLIWRGRWHLNRLNRNDVALARDMFERALVLDPNAPEALIQSAYLLGWSNWISGPSEAPMLDMRKMAKRAIIADSDDGRGYMLAGIAENWLRRPLVGRSLLQTAIMLNPSLAMAHSELGHGFCLAGEPDCAVAPFRTALHLNPTDPYLFSSLAGLAMSYLMMGQWAEAIGHAEQALLRRGDYWYARLSHINALVRSGNLSGARASASVLLEQKPDFSRRYIEWLPFTDRTWIEFLIEGLHMTRVGDLDFQRSGGEAGES